MISVDHIGSLAIKLTVSGDTTISASLSNLKLTATDADIYAVGVAVAALTEYAIASMTRSENALLNA